MNNWTAHISKVDNGYTFTTDDDCEVIEDDTDDGKEAMTKLLNRIADYFGFNYDGFSDSNLNIKWNLKGDEL